MKSWRKHHKHYHEYWHWALAMQLMQAARDKKER